MSSVQKAANIILNKCLALKSHEKCLIITDKNKISIGKALFEEAKKITEDSKIIDIPIGKVHGEEPSLDVAKKMLEFDVIVIPTTKSLSHTKARMAATKKGIRLATLPGITEDIMERAIDVDYDKMKELTNRLADILDEGRIIRVTTSAGTDITLNIEDVQAHGRKGGIFDKTGFWGNMPEAEAFLAPKQNGTSGVYVIDASQAGVGKVEIPIKITVENGFATKIEGGDEAKKLKELLEGINDKNAFNIAELGIGTNKSAKITGITLEDEKVFGTCHIALGKNDSFGGTVDVPIHVDGIMRSPTIIVDGKEIIREGKLLI